MYFVVPTRVGVRVPSPEKVDALEMTAVRLSIHRKPHEVQEIARVLCTASAAVFLLRLLLLLLYFESTMLGVGEGDGPC